MTGNRRWIPAFARMTDECGNSCPLRHSCAPPSFLRRQESIPVFASGGAGEKMDPRVREDDGRMRSFLPPPSFLRRPESIPVFVSYVEGKKMDLRMREDDRGSQMDPRMREDDESISPFLPPPSFLRRACPRPDRGQESIPHCCRWISAFARMTGNSAMALQPFPRR